MNLFAHFFIFSDQTNEPIMASELRLDYSPDFKHAKDDDRRITPVTHGYDFAKTYNHDLEVNLESFIVKSYHFDASDHFVGFSIMNYFSDKVTNYIALGVDQSTMKTYEVDNVLFLEHYERTRLIGFRTSKRCKQTNYINSVQPIYYSLDEKMCKEHLQLVTPGMLEEINDYGLDCADS